MKSSRSMTTILLSAAAVVLLAAAPVVAQGTGGTGGGGGGTGGAGGGGTGGGGAPPGGAGPTTSQTNTPSNDPKRPLFVIGQVRMSTGEPLPERAEIERFCSVAGAQTEGYTDAEGHFSLQLGINRGLVADAAFGRFENGQGNLALPQSTNFGPSETRFWNCELRANLPGYISSTVTLAGRRYFDPPDIGVIVLRPMRKPEGLSVSATSQLAPKDAREAFEDGMNAMEDQDFKDAEKAFKKAVGIFERHAEAWHQLGLVYRERDKPQDAQKAFLKAIEADSNFLLPYEQLYQLAFERNDLADLADKTESLLRLNPYEFPLAHYYSAVANLQLKNYELAEQRARTAIQMDPNNENPKAFFVLGFVLASTGALPEAAESFRTFLDLHPDGVEAMQAQGAMNQIRDVMNQRQDGRPVNP